MKTIYKFINKIIDNLQVCQGINIWSAVLPTDIERLVIADDPDNPETSGWTEVVFLKSGLYSPVQIRRYNRDGECHERRFLKSFSEFLEENYFYGYAIIDDKYIPQVRKFTIDPGVYEF